MRAIEFEKAPAADLVYSVDFVHLIPEGDTLQSATATGGAGITVSSVTVSGTEVLIRVSGGTALTTYRLEVKGTFGSGLSDVVYVDFAVRVPVPVL